MMPYETRSERLIRIGQYTAAVAFTLLVIGGILAGLWGLTIPDPSTR